MAAFTTVPGVVDTSPAAATSGRREWRLLLLGSLVSSVGAGLTLPFLIVYLHAVRHASLPFAGLIVAVAGVAGLAVGAIGGSAGDHYGVGRILLCGLVISGMGTVALALIARPALAALAVALIGAGDALSWPALNALIAGQFPPEERSRAYAMRFGVLNAGIGIGALVSGAVVSLRHPGSFEALYLVDGATSVCFAAIVAVVLRASPTSRAVHQERAAFAAGDDEAVGYRAVLADRRFVGWLACSAVFVLFGYAQLDGAWAAFATGVVGAPPRVVGFGFAVNTAVIVVSQLGVVRLTRRWRRSRLLAGVGALWAVAFAVTGLADWSALSGFPSDAALVASLGIFGLGETLLTPVSGGLPNDLAPEHLRGRYNALSTTVWAAGGLVGPPMAGVLLGSATPLSWVVVVTVGCGLASVGGLRLARSLPAAIDRPQVDASA